MEITRNLIKVRDLVEGYINDLENGVKGYSGKLDIRPPFQREFVYKDEKRNEVIRTLRKGRPLNIMYWGLEGGSMEVIDGQQRIISICDYVSNLYCVDFQYYMSLDEPSKEQILDYELEVFLCQGSPEERLEWFTTINIAGMALNDQELRNSVYTGSWLSDAKRYFSKTGCPAYSMGKDYLTGTPINQDYLKTVIGWAAKGSDDESIREYMSLHRIDTDATPLWLYFQNVINWVKAQFPDYNKYMKGINWGGLYDESKGSIKPNLKPLIDKLMQDEDVTDKKGVYAYVLDNNPSYLNIRKFTDAQKMTVYSKQKGICIKCSKPFDIKDMEGDHITPWSEGGKTDIDNLQMLCKADNRIKSNK